MTGNLNWPIWNNVKPENPKKYNKLLGKKPNRAPIEPHWSHGNLLRVRFAGLVCGPQEMLDTGALQWGLKDGEPQTKPANKFQFDKFL